MSWVYNSITCDLDQVGYFCVLWFPQQLNRDKNDATLSGCYEGQMTVFSFLIFKILGIVSGMHSKH